MFTGCGEEEYSIIVIEYGVDRIRRQGFDINGNTSLCLLGAWRCCGFDGKVFNRCCGGRRI